ncbi:MAG: hypothetical protein A3A04_00430 [Candidatus Harrisonbacteria bacterium RIFCSPLOWO2_01_FULL_40_28]|uniref:Uncharacterized protein n=2 Tax=Candidatus Harrisoniibacteriota TaxID=1817905 RepID=A0A1G1ZUY6_9BACT|nr:MAG: hypothetical protein A3A04_00430 [Candidatus Harrisonbacteria bacterium RIFCSPLOWO2_01_FULL_40_28]OGY68503.1 MAG: hypothetical protein A2586_02115 [Candidatus Harrisonbacteria bacterium RIFOXYD1_FULL_40_9]
MNPRFLISTLALVALGLIVQESNVMRIGNFVPNIVLVSGVVFAALWRGWLWRIFIILFATGITMTSIGLEAPLLYLLVAMILGMMIIDSLPWYPLINVPIVIVMQTLIFNAFLFSKRWSFYFQITSWDVLYNVVIALFLFFIFSLYIRPSDELIF